MLRRARTFFLVPALCIAMTGAFVALLAYFSPASERPFEAQEKLLGSAGARNYRPCLAEAPDGTVILAWLSWKPNEGAVILASRSKDGEAWSEPEALTDHPGGVVRPVLSRDGEGRVWCLWSANVKGNSDLYGRAWNGKAWGPPERVTTDSGPDFNVEATLDPGGGMTIVWQALRDGNFNIFTKRFFKGAWSPELALSINPAGDWDPAVASDGEGVWCVWSAYTDKDYDLHARRWTPAGGWGPVRAIVEKESYALHPSLAPSGEPGSVLVAWDAIRIANHDSGAGQFIEQPELRQATLESFELRAGLLGPEGLRAAPVPEAKWIVNGGLAKIAAQSDGEVCACYRLPGPHDKRGGGFSGWKLALRLGKEGTWGKSFLLDERMSPFEEPAFLSAKDALWVAWMSEEPRPRGPKAQPPKDPAWPPADVKEHLGPYAACAVGGTESRIRVLRASRQAGQARGARAPAGSALVPWSDPTYAKPKPEARPSIAVDGQTYHLYWGDLHRHSQISRCHQALDPSLADHYKYALDVHHFDFFAMTDHAEHTNPYHYWETEEMADLHYVPGTLAPLHGFEWSSGLGTGLKGYGHKNVISPERVPLFPATGNEKDPPGLWKALAGKRVLTIPHHPASFIGTDWSFHDPEMQRLVEIYSVHWGSSEQKGAPRQCTRLPKKNPETVDDKYVDRALARGYRLGFIASSDHGYGAAYAVAWAKALDRESIFEALRARRCYGSTVYGLVLEFWVNDRPMGEEIAGVQGPRTIRLKVEAPEAIKKVDVFRNAEVVWSWKPDGMRFEKTQEDKAEIARGGCYYYLRAELKDGELGWSSPVWVSGP